MGAWPSGPVPEAPAQIGQGLLPEGLHPQLSQPEVDRDSVAQTPHFLSQAGLDLQQPQTSRNPMLGGWSQTDPRRPVVIQSSAVGECQASERPSRKIGRERVFEERKHIMSVSGLYTHMYVHEQVYKRTPQNR